MLRNFICSGRKAKIAMSTLCALKDQGGPGLCNIRAKRDALKICLDVQDRRFSTIQTTGLQSDHPYFE